MILFVLLALLVCVFFSGGYVFYSACFRKKERAWFDENALKNTPYEKFYQSICDTDRWLRTHNAEDVYITSEDGLKLHGLWVPVQEAKGTVLLAHGYRSTIYVEFRIAVEFFHSLGFNLLLPDQRSHGKSEGKFITFGVKESEDMRGWIRLHNDTFGNYPMVLYGISMGASTMLYLADQQLPENIRGIIADCGFTSPKEILSSVFKAVTHLPAGPSIWVAGLFAKVFAGFRLDEKNTKQILAASRYPILMIHGAADDFVPCEMTFQGYEACCASKTLLIVEGAEHGYSMIKNPVRYGDTLLEFVKNNVEGLA